jgi:hypothetical protein
MTGRLQHSESFTRLSEIGNSTPPEGGGFAYDEPTMRTLITKWLELADRYLDSSRRLDTGPIEGPGLDFASKAQAEAATNSTKAYYAYLAKNYWYCVEQAQLLQDTLNDYLGIEHRSVIDFSRSGPQAEI